MLGGYIHQAFHTILNFYSLHAGSQTITFTQTCNAMKKYVVPQALAVHELAIGACCRSRAVKKPFLQFNQVPVRTNNGSYARS